MTPSDRSVLTRLASALPQSSEERAALQGLLSREASVKAQEPYQKVEGHPYGRGKVDVIKGVRTERELRDLSKLLDDSFQKPLTRDLISKLKKWGVGPVGMEAITSGEGYMLYLTDATGEEYDVFNDLGI
jgi:hypothetical protein